KVDPAFLGRDDARVGREVAVLDDQGAVQERGDGGGVEGRDGIALGPLGGQRRLRRDGATGARAAVRLVGGADAPGAPQPGLGAHHRLQLDGATGARAAVRIVSAVDAPGEPQPGLGAAAIEEDHVTGIYPVRITDRFTVEVPDFGPAPGLLEKAPGNVPEGVT